MVPSIFSNSKVRKRTIRETWAPQGIANLIYLYEKLNQTQRSTTYHHTFAMAIAGNLQINKLLHAINLLVERHPALRSKIIQNNDSILFESLISHQAQNLAEKLITIVELPQAPPPLAELMTTLAAINQGQVVTQPFNMEEGPLWRGILLKFANQQYQLLFNFHHLIIDLTSQNTFLAELSEIYNALCAQRLPLLAQICDDKPVLSETEQQRKLNYWQKQLDELSLVHFPTDFPSQSFNFQGDRIYFAIETPLVDELKKLANLTSVSLNTILLAGIYALIYRYNDAETDLCIGIATSGRKQENALRCFVNSLPMRVIINESNDFVSLLRQIKQTVKEGLENQLPLDEIITNTLSRTVKSATHTATPFKILVNLFTQPLASLTLANTVCSEPIELNLRHCKFEHFVIGFNIKPDGSLAGILEYNTELFKRTSIEDLIAHLKILYQAIANNPQLTISEIPILTEAEKKLIAQIHQTQRHTPDNEFFHTLFTKAAKTNPNKKAITFHDKNNAISEMTYAQLDKASDLLAAYLINVGISPDIPVGVCIKGPAKIIASIAIFKAGGVVVPLETENDQQTLVTVQHKITDTLIQIVLVDNETENLFPTTKLNKSFIFTLNIEKNNYLKIGKELGHTYVKPKLSADNLAYIVYTSGTTGEPKGVMIKHGGLTNLIYEIFDRKLTIENWLGMAPLTFDAFFFDLAMLCHGFKLHLINADDRLRISVLIKIIQDFKINGAAFTPEILQQLDPVILPSLKYVISMGEIPNQEMLDRWGEKSGNECGPTETTICATRNRMQPGKSYKNIGKPIRNVCIFVLDKHFRTCPIGIPGELYISGPGVARGYVAQSELTKQKFPIMIYDENNQSFSPIPLIDETKHLCKKRKPEPNLIQLYATNDLGRYVKDLDGSLSIEFLGRKDESQVKIHGVRIEIEGVKKVLEKHSLIKQAIIRPNAAKTALIAYLLTKDNAVVTKKMLDAHLKTTAIPYIAWPKYIEHLQAIPITKNGKVNIKDLSDPAEIAPIYVGPKNDLQLQLCQIWSEVLRINVVDTQQRFREIGGNSLEYALLESTLTKRFALPQEIRFAVFNKDMNILELEQLLLSIKPLLDKNNLSPLLSGSLFSGQETHSFTFQPDLSWTQTCFRFKQ